MRAAQGLPGNGGRCNGFGPSRKSESAYLKLCLWLTAHRACDHCTKANRDCYKPQHSRRTACRWCFENKKSCFRGDPKSKSKHPAPGSSKAKDNSEAHEYSIVESIQELRQEVVGLRGELVGLKGGQARLIAGNAYLKERFENIEALLLGKQAKGKGKPDDEDEDMGTVT